MTRITTSSSRVVFRDGKAGTGQECCCSQCNVNDTVTFGGEASGVRSSVHYGFVSGQACVKIAFNNAFPGADVTVFAFFPASVIYSGTVPAGESVLCLLKPDGPTSVEIRIANQQSNPTYSYTVTCDTCDCNPLP